MKNLVRLILVLTLLIITLGVGVRTAAAQGGSFVYTVQYGDTLGRIAARFGTTVQAIASLNGIYNVNVIYIGQRLTVPSGGTVAVHPVHTVQWGENLFRIGLQYGWNTNTMAALNNIPNPNYIQAGQRLLVPQARYHTVQWGDTLTRIAAQYGSTVSAIMTTNLIYNPNLIYPGQVLLVP